MDAHKHHSVPVMKTSEARGQHVRPVLFPPSGDAGKSSTARTGRIRSKVSVCWMLFYVEKMCNLQVGIACRILGIASNVIEGSPPMLPDKIQAAGRQLWLALQVEFTEESLPDGLQRLTLAPEHHTAFQLFK